MTSWEEVAQSEAVHQPPITPSKLAERRMIAERDRVVKRINEELTPRRFGRR
jgi:hypothetical protein